MQYAAFIMSLWRADEEHSEERNWRHPFVTLAVERRGHRRHPYKTAGGVGAPEGGRGREKKAGGWGRGDGWRDERTVALPSVYVFWPTALLSGPMPKLGEVTHQLIATRERLRGMQQSLHRKINKITRLHLARFFMEKYSCLIRLNHEVELQSTRVLHPHYDAVHSSCLPLWTVGVETLLDPQKMTNWHFRAKQKTLSKTSSSNGALFSVGLTPD